MLYKVEEGNVQGFDGGMAEIRPFSLKQTALAFGIPTVAMAISFHWAIPALQALGLTPFESMIVAYVVPMALMFTAALVMYHEVDGYPLARRAFSRRFRYPRLTLKAGLQGVGLFVAVMLGYGLFNGVSLWLIEQGWIGLPDNLLPFFDPRIGLSAAVLNETVGGQIAGNWSVVILYAIMFIFNVVSEELWWRGYILPRQELRHGRFTWVLHGLLWTLFHVFKWWDLIGLLPVCLGIAYVSQRTKNNWPAFIAHFLFNGLALIIITTAVIVG